MLCVAFVNVIDVTKALRMQISLCMERDFVFGPTLDIQRNSREGHPMRTEFTYSIIEKVRLKVKTCPSVNLF